MVWRPSVCSHMPASSSPAWNELLSFLHSLRSAVNLHRPSDLLSVHCHAATCSLASIPLPPCFFSSSFWSEQVKGVCLQCEEKGGMGGGRGGGLGLLVSMVISLCVCVFVERIGDKGVEELKVIVDGVASWFKGKMKYC